MAQLTSIHRFPVKSCRGESVGSAVVEPWGLAGDRRWMVVDDAGAGITAREVNRLVLVHPEITDGGLRITAPDLPALEVPTPDPARQVPVAIWSSTLTAAAAGAEADAWISKALGVAARLVHLDDPTRRPTSPAFSEPGDLVSFADGYPVLLTTEESLAALNDVVLASADTGRDPLPMTRFRPNVVVSGVEPWAEDDWRRIRIGDAVFRAVKGCARCVLTTIDPDSAVREKEPIRSLAKIRRWDGATWFGINLVPDTYDVTIRVGDEFEVLEAVAPGSGPLRPAP
ncbi:MOSC domain-containing protein [Nocardioides mangrovi]|uniref:MOSC domain-containing protein n=1 Tax=Nocardioides mangrovi TaxID=2874580 RepID=A0ABS7UKB1_9ACTN|nr:MOSC N-terminal beta barrel domain-containing protein [Nocardioides mangrovi]MBZ5741337.1 MOSC domain-containing protein [Nocardioides mangrovi]